MSDKALREALERAVGQQRYQTEAHPATDEDEGCFAVDLCQACGNDWPCADEDCWVTQARAALTQPPAAPVADGLTPFEKRAADALADEVAVLVRRGVIDSRSRAGDALLDYRNPPFSERSEKIAADLARNAVPRSACPTCGDRRIDVAAAPVDGAREALERIANLCFCPPGNYERCDVESHIIARAAIAQQPAPTPLAESRPCTCGRTPLVHRHLSGAISIHCACGLHLFVNAPPSTPPVVVEDRPPCDFMPSSSASKERLDVDLSEWPIADVLDRLADAADHLRGSHQCDIEGHEGFLYAAQAARAHAKLLRAPPVPAPPQAPTLTNFGASSPKEVSCSGPVSESGSSSESSLALADSTDSSGSQAATSDEKKGDEREAAEVARDRPSRKEGDARGGAAGSTVGNQESEAPIEGQARARELREELEHRWKLVAPLVAAARAYRRAGYGLYGATERDVRTRSDELLRAAEIMVPPEDAPPTPTVQADTRDQGDKDRCVECGGRLRSNGLCLECCVYTRPAPPKASPPDDKVGTCDRLAWPHPNVEGCRNWTPAPPKGEDRG